MMKKGLLLLWLTAWAQSAFAHQSIHGHDNPRGFSQVNWSRDNIERVVTAGYPDTFGLFAFTRRQPLQFKTVAGKRCVKANFLAFDIKDSFAYDINEPVTLEVLVELKSTASLIAGFDQNGRADANQAIELPDGDGLVWLKTQLNKARLANRGMGQSDFALTTLETMLPESQLSPNQTTTFTLCDVKLTRSHQTVEKPSPVSVRFNFKDEHNKPTPVRVGIYDKEGNAALVDDSALTLSFYARKVKQLNLRAAFAPYQYWPHANRYYFYSDGHYTTKLSPGEYTLIASKGPEYHIAKHSFKINQSEQPQSIAITLKRWADLKKAGWYSGDVHIHMPRERQDNERFHAMLEAEDLHVANMLEMSNAGHNHFPQYAFGTQGSHVSNTQAIVPGIEGPRTAHRGHALALNVQSPLHGKDNYFLYHKHLQSYQNQQATTGYAHVGSEEFYASRGLALDVPFGLIDFVEIMQNNRMRPQLWYEFLNLGFRLAPAAGSDFPYFDQPGAVRSYVYTDSIFDYRRWFEGLEAGRTFVSNAPMIDVKVDNQLPGSTLPIKPLIISTKVSINPDYDKVRTVELLYCGDVIKQFIDGKPPSFQFTPPGTGWLAIRAYGEDFALAHSGAFYIVDKHQNSQCNGKVKDEAHKMLKRLTLLENAQINPQKELEYWETTEIENMLQKQLPALRKRIEKAKAFYRSLF